MIHTDNLGKQFDGFWAVESINLDIAAGEVLALIGPNGAGKTTTVRMLTSILQPSRGSATIAGFDVVRDADRVRSKVGVLTEQHGLYGRMHAEEYLDFFGQLYGMNASTRKSRVRQLLENFGLYPDRNRRIGEYSKGMRQKLALARALLHDPPILLLDEPTSAMDPESARLVRDAIRELRSASRSIIICSHNLAEAEELADKIAIIRRGRIIALGAPEALKLDFLGPVEYEVQLGVKLNGSALKLPLEVSLTSCGPDWLRYRTSAPRRVNPEVLRSLLDNGLPVVGLRQVPRSLEQVYLHAIQVSDDGEAASAK